VKLHILAIGKIGKSPEARLVSRYLDRIAWPTAVTELPDTRPQMPPLPLHAKTVVLDERGAPVASVALAARLDQWRNDGVREVRFLIGGADGHTPETRSAADLLLSFGPATWPHLLARAMLAEQLFRAVSILANHPYHRGN
jgi:23S rRNA (pseudouridine1915-N3)-methyltransferase